MWSSWCVKHILGPGWSVEKEKIKSLPLQIYNVEKQKDINKYES